MGTNYDIKYKICDKCGRYDELHLGKSSYGWRFALQANNFEYYKDWREMKIWLKKMCKNNKGKIYDEYDEEVGLEEFITLVESKQLTKQYVDRFDGYRFCNYEFS